MKLDHCKVTVSDHVLDIFIGTKKNSFNIEDINKINAIETTEGSHTGKILGTMLGTGAQIATGDFFGVLQVIGTGAGGAGIVSLEKYKKKREKSIKFSEKI